MAKDKNAGIYVEVKPEEDQVAALDKAIKKLKKKMKKSNIMVDLFNSQFFRKPSDVKREKKRKAISRNRYKVREEHERDNPQTRGK
jgi:ribosomal protein S21